jgi:hypothetical protein
MPPRYHHKRASQRRRLHRRRPRIRSSQGHDHYEWLSAPEQEMKCSYGTRWLTQEKGADRQRDGAVPPFIPHRGNWAGTAGLSQESHTAAPPAATGTF